MSVDKKEEEKTERKVLLIAFCGGMGIGKNTCVDYLIDKYGGVRLAFTDPLYDIKHYAQTICGFPHEKDRKFLQ